MMAGKSISHVNQGIGTCYSKDKVAGYYNDLTEKITKDDPDILVPKYHVDSGEEIYFSIGIFQYGLGSYDLLLKTQEDAYRQKLLACADWAVENQQINGSWVTFAYENPEHPYSSMAQGEGISMLLRAYIVTKDEKYMEAACKAKDFMLKPLNEGGTTEYVEDNVFLYEYTAEPLVLNGWIFSYWGLRDFHLMTGNADVKNIATKTVKTMIKFLQHFDLKYWSRYDLTKRIASPFYHKLHIAQLHVMYDLTSEVAYKKYAEKWEAYLQNPICKSRAFLKKAMQKIFER